MLCGRACSELCSTSHTMPLQKRLPLIKGHETCMIVQEHLDCMYAVLLVDLSLSLQRLYCRVPAECSEPHVFCIGEDYVQNMAHQRAMRLRAKYT